MMDFNFFNRLHPIQTVPEWTNQITAVDLTGLHVHHVTCLDQLVNLKWACFRDNTLTSIEVQCTLITYYILACLLL